MWHCAGPRHLVGVAVEHDAPSLFTVAARTACLLVIPLDRLRDRVVDDEAHVGLVDAHAKCDCCHDDVGMVVGPAHLDVSSLVGRDTSMVVLRIDPMFRPQLFCELDCVFLPPPPPHTHTRKSVGTIAAARREGPKRLGSAKTCRGRAGVARHGPSSIIGHSQQVGRQVCLKAGVWQAGMPEGRGLAGRFA